MACLIGESNADLKSIRKLLLLCCNLIFLIFNKLNKLSLVLFSKFCLNSFNLLFHSTHLVNLSKIISVNNFAIASENAIP